MKVKLRRLRGGTVSFTKATPSKAVASPTPRAPKEKKERKARYSCAESVVTASGKRVEVTTVPAAENRAATARCYTPAVWTPAMEESLPELSNIDNPNPPPVVEPDMDLDWSSIPVELDDYDPELDPDNV